MKKAILLLLFLLSLSIWHKHLDWDKDWIPCEHLSPNNK